MRIYLTVTKFFQLLGGQTSYVQFGGNVSEVILGLQSGFWQCPWKGSTNIYKARSPVVQVGTSVACNVCEGIKSKYQHLEVVQLTLTGLLQMVGLSHSAEHLTVAADLVVGLKLPG